MAEAIITRTVDFEKVTKRFARYVPRVEDGAEEPDIGILYVGLAALGDTPVQTSLEVSFTPVAYEPQPPQARGGKAAAA
jgi:hypothetical protein